jgi:hypothetical protein
VKRAARVAATVGAALLPLACSLPLGGLGVVGQEGGSPEAANGVEGVNPGDSGALGTGEGGDPTAEDGADSTVDSSDDTSGDDRDDTRDHHAGDETDGGAPTDHDAGGDANPDADGGADAKVDAAPDGGIGGGDAEAGGPSPPTFVQVNAVVPQAPQISLGVDYTIPQAAGDLNVVVVGWNDSVALVRSVSDSAGNAYALAVGPTIDPGIFSQSIYYAKNIAATAGKNTVTVQFNVAAGFADIRIVEYQGLDPDNPLDVGAGAHGLGATSSAGPIVTTAADLLVAANIVGVLTNGPGPGFTSRIITDPDSDIVEDRFAPLPGSYSATAPITPSTQWVMQIVAFRAK